MKTVTHILIILLVVGVLIILFISRFNRKHMIKPIRQGDKLNLRPSHRNLFMCYHTKSKIPQKVFDNLETYAPEYTLYLYDDDDIIEFFKTNYRDHQRYIDRFNQLHGAHKADLWRYCALYHYGGLYMDVKTVLTRPLREIFTRDDTLYTVNSMVTNTIYQGIIKTPPRNPIFLQLIEYVLRSSQGDVDKDYHIFTKDFYDKLQGYSGDYTLFNEYCDRDACDRNDRYGLCCYIYRDKEMIIKTRFEDFPW